MLKRYYFFLIVLLFSCEAEISKVPFVEDFELLTNREKVDFLRESLQSNPDNASILIQIANSFVEVDIDSAIHYGKLALENTDRKGPVYFSLANIYSRGGQSERALESALKAEEYSLVSSELKNLIASQYLQIGDYAKADLYLSQALQLADANQESLFMQAKLDLVKGDTANAIEKFLANDLPSLQYEMMLQMGLIAFSRQEDSAAIEYYKQAIKIEAQHPSPYRQLAQIYERRQEPDSALLMLGSIPMEYGDLMRTAEIYYNQLVWDSTLVFVSRAAVLDSTTSDPYLLKAKVYMGRRNFSRSRQIYDSLIMADSTDLKAIEGRRILDGRIQYLVRQQEERKREDSIKFRPLRIREF